MKLLTNTFLLAAFLFLPVRVFSQTQQDELEQIRQNYIGTLISSNDESDLLNRILSGIPPETEMSDQVVVELHQRYPFNMEKIKGYMESINEDGSWPDINYTDTKRSGWDAKKHADRILELAKLYHAEGPSSENTAISRLKDDILKSLLFPYISIPPESAEESLPAAAVKYRKAPDAAAFHLLPA